MIDRFKHKLRTKYGLCVYPTPDQLEVWLYTTESEQIIDDQE